MTVQDLAADLDVLQDHLAQAQRWRQQSSVHLDALRFAPLRSSGLADFERIEELVTAIQGEVIHIGDGCMNVVHALAALEDDELTALVDRYHDGTEYDSRLRCGLSEMSGWRVRELVDSEIRSLRERVHEIRVDQLRDTDEAQQVLSRLG